MSDPIDSLKNYLSGDPHTAPPHVEPTNDYPDAVPEEFLADNEPELTLEVLLADDAPEDSFATGTDAYGLLTGGEHLVMEDIPAVSFSDFLLTDMNEIEIPPQYLSATTNNTPETIEKMAEPEPEPEPEAEQIPDYVINIINDSEHPNLRKAIVEDDGSISLYLAEGVHVAAVSYEQIHVIVQAGKTEFPAFQVVKVNINPNEQRACKWFTPTRDQVEAYGAVESDEYTYDRPHKYGSCSNPQIIKDTGHAVPICPWFAQAEPFSKCGEYSADPIKIEKAMVSTVPEDGITLKLTKVRRNFGLQEYDIIKEDVNGIGLSVLESPILTDDISTNWEAKIDDAWTQAINNHIGEGVAVVDVTHKFVPEKAEKEPYINHVLQV